jgi:hypothetical protein
MSRIAIVIFTETVLRIIIYTWKYFIFEEIKLFEKLKKKKRRGKIDNKISLAIVGSKGPVGSKGF